METYPGILLAEDDPNDVELTLEALSQHDLADRVTVVGDGLEVLRELRSDPGLKRVPVVILTSSREEKDILTSYDLGVNAHVVKPVAFQESIEAVESLAVFWALIDERPAAPRPRGDARGHKRRDGRTKPEVGR